MRPSAAGEIGRRNPEWRYRLTRLLKPRRLQVDGFRLVGWGAGMPKHLAALLARGDYEGPERRAVAAFVRQGDRVLEIGACIGLVSLTAARIVGAENIVVYEPNPNAAAVAERNFANNNLRVRLVPRAIDAEQGVRRLSVGFDSWLGASLYRDLNEIETAVQVDAIAEVMRDVDPTILIIDAEGAESSIMAACPLAGLRAIIIELHPGVIGADGAERIRERFRQAGFSPATAYCEDDTECWVRAS